MEKMKKKGKREKRKRKKGRGKGKGGRGKGNKQKPNFFFTSIRNVLKNSGGTLKLTFLGHQNAPLSHGNPKIFFAGGGAKI